MENFQSFEIEYAWFECRDCGYEVELLLSKPEDLDACVEELGHVGHNYVVTHEERGW